MNSSLPPYTAVIRSLGKAGEKYQILLNSLVSQTHPPQKIIVYLAEGYEKPKETVGVEDIIYVPKGMVAQRALPYKEVSTEWMLFLDDDVSIEKWGVEKMLVDTIKAGADVCSFDAFPHHQLPLSSKIAMALLLSSIPRIGGKNKGYRVNFLGTDCYNPKPKNDFAFSTTNAGPAFICKKDDFLKIHFDEDIWLDKVPVAFPEDKVMYYKMHLNGLKILTHYNSGFFHMDAGTSTISHNSREKLLKCEYSAAHNNYIFNKLYVKPSFSSLWNFLSVPLRLCISVNIFFYDLFKYKNFKEIWIIRKKGRNDAKQYLKLKYSKK